MNDNKRYVVLRLTLLPARYEPDNDDTNYAPSGAFHSLSAALYGFLLPSRLTSRLHPLAFRIAIKASIHAFLTTKDPLT